MSAFAWTAVNRADWLGLHPGEGNAGTPGTSGVLAANGAARAERSQASCWNHEGSREALRILLNAGVATERQITAVRLMLTLIPRTMDLGNDALDALIKDQVPSVSCRSLVHRHQQNLHVTSHGVAAIDSDISVFLTVELWKITRHFAYTVRSSVRR